jgi:AcrR family transcriptional regulator
VPDQSAADRLKQALADLTAPDSDSCERVTVSALCQMANVSRNSLYRYHPEILRALREHQRQRDSAVTVSLRHPVYPQQAELAAMRDQFAKLAALVDHYYEAYREAQALLSRREQDLADLRRRLDAKPATIAR